ncbi:MAG: AAA family ATPase [Aquihabitans sp.]
MTADHWSNSPDGDAAGSPHLIGRDVERSALHDALRLALDGHPHLVVVEGAAGIGKSALLRQFARAVDGQVAVLKASGDEAEQHLDYGLIEQLHAEAAVHGLQVPPMFGREGPRPDPLDIGSSLVQVATAASTDQPLLLIIDDAQWGDSASLQAITYALRRLRAQAVLTVIAQRPDVPALAPLSRLCQDERGARLRLAGLGSSHLDELLRQARGIALGEQAAQRLHEHTGGNPLEALTLADELDAETISSGIGPLPAPRSYATLALNRLAGCRPETERLVAAVAVMGTPVEVGPLVDMLGLDGLGALAGPLDEAVTERHLLMVERAGRQMVDVAHPLLRSAVVDDLPPGLRSELHLLAATVTDDPARAMVHRLRGTITHDSGLGVEATTLARELLGAGWDLTAVELLSEAAKVLPDGSDRTEAMLLAANRLFTTGEMRAARELLARVHGDGGALGLLVRGQDLLHRGHTKAAWNSLMSAWERSPEPRVAGQVAGLLATLSSNAGQGSRSITWAHAALEHAEPAGSELSHAFVMLATGWAFDGDLKRGLAEIDRWLDRLTPQPRSRFGRDDALLARALLLLWSGRFVEAERTFDEILDVGETLGPLLTRVTASYSRADARYRQGNWDGALKEAERLVAIMAAGDHDLARPMAHGVAAFVHAGRGAVDHAERHLAEGHAAQVRSDNTSGLLWLLIGDARIGSATGDHHRVVTQLQPLADLLKTSGLGEGVQPWRADLVEALVGLHRLDEAQDALTELERRIESGGVQAQLGAARARGLLLAALGDDDAAEAAFTSGLTTLPPPTDAEVPFVEPTPTDGGPFLQARLELAAGSFARRRGRRRHAADLLTAAAGRFDNLKAAPYLQRARHELEACGLAPRARCEGGPAPLTPAERQVAALVAKGLTNRDVANRLHVSVKTVESHLARCFTKLDVRTRTALAVRWTEQTASPDGRPVPPPTASGAR